MPLFANQESSPIDDPGVQTAYLNTPQTPLTFSQASIIINIIFSSFHNLTQATQLQAKSTLHPLTTHPKCAEPATSTSPRTTCACPSQPNPSQPSAAPMSSCRRSTRSAIASTGPRRCSRPTRPSSARPTSKAAFNTGAAYNGASQRRVASGFGTIRTWR